MSEIVIIIGLPSSGKSTYAQHPKFGKCISFDDMFLHYRSPEAAVDDTNAHTLTDCLSKSRSIIINDPHLCNTSARQQLIGWLYENSFQTPSIELIFFENNPEQCIKNSRLNLDKPVDQYIRLLTNNYSIPSNYQQKPVCQAFK
jgi:predicted kinase